LSSAEKNAAIEFLDDNDHLLDTTNLGVGPYDTFPAHARGTRHKNKRSPPLEWTSD